MARRYMQGNYRETMIRARGREKEYETLCDGGQAASYIVWLIVGMYETTCRNLSIGRGVNAESVKG